MLLLDKLHAPIFFLSLLVPALIVAAIEGSFYGFVSGLLWGGLFRVFVTDQAECSLRGISHYFGPSDLNTRGSSRNHWIAYIAMGEWHNNHHAFPNSAKHGFKWWQIDTGYLFIAFLKLFHLAWDIQSVSEERIRSKEISPPNLALNND